MKIINKIISSSSILITGLILGIGVREIPQVNTQIEKTISSSPPLTNYKNSQENSFPTSAITVNRPCYSLSYDFRTRNAHWIYERLTADSLKGNADRSHFQFTEDGLIPELFRSTLKDYKGSGFDRGHLAPAANHKASPQEMKETFFLSNMSPQNPQLNRGYWSKLEKYVRDLTRSYAVVNVFTGPLYLPKQGSNGEKWVKYQVIGDNNVAVPTHFFKVLVLEKHQGGIEYQAYVLPNEPIDPKTHMDKFKLSLDKLEKASGIIFKKGKAPELLNVGFI